VSPDFTWRWHREILIARITLIREELS